jgi:hypothetical protein
MSNYVLEHDNSEDDFNDVDFRFNKNENSLDIDIDSFNQQSNYFKKPIIDTTSKYSSVVTNNFQEISRQSQKPSNIFNHAQTQTLQVSTHNSSCKKTLSSTNNSNLISVTEIRKLLKMFFLQ